MVLRCRMFFLGLLMFLLLLRHRPSGHLPLPRSTEPKAEGDLQYDVGDAQRSPAYHWLYCRLNSFQRRTEWHCQDCLRRACSRGSPVPPAPMVFSPPTDHTDHPSVLLVFAFLLDFLGRVACLGISRHSIEPRGMHRQWIESEDIVFGLMQNWSGWEVQKLRPDEGNSSGLNSSNSSFGWTDGRPDGAGDPSAETIMNWDPLWLPEGTVSRRQKGLLCQLID